MVLLVHAYYIAGITNLGDFISDQKGPWWVKFPSGLDLFELGDYSRSLRLQEIMGGR